MIDTFIDCMIYWTAFLIRWVLSLVNEHVYCYDSILDISAFDWIVLWSFSAPNVTLPYLIEREGAYIVTALAGNVYQLPIFGFTFRYLNLEIIRKKYSLPLLWRCNLTKKKRMYVFFPQLACFYLSID